MLNAKERWDVKDMFLNLISQILSIFLLVLCESVLFNEGFSTDILFHAICRTLNTSICLAFVAFSRKGSFNETAAWLAQYAERRSAVPEVAVSNPGRTNTQGLQITEKKVLSL